MVCNYLLTNLAEMTSVVSIPVGGLDGLQLGKMLSMMHIQFGFNPRGGIRWSATRSGRLCLTVNRSVSIPVGGLDGLQPQAVEAIRNGELVSIPVGGLDGLQHFINL